eukprot:CAMPEP_0181506806 /NCGR_PEP_ID=MMETSP1110-20121109/58792_1 /TAXON_ID=174948 /ORGANISM="Symbiodinium sp., Strain CCMP421" /LENGTH=98 /DNA_ID=CAMNT_0023635891 /DNA_START=191 /DNA_END=484 /DNA_ORIENTATION=+
MGQLVSSLLLHQLRMQLSWKAWEQLSWAAICPASCISKQITHTSSRQSWTSLTSVTSSFSFSFPLPSSSASSASSATRLGSCTPGLDRRGDPTQVTTT